MSKIRLFAIRNPRGSTMTSNLYLSHAAAERERTRAWANAIQYYPSEYFYYEEYGVVELTWQEREQAFFNAGVYGLPVWHKAITAIDDHYAHAALNDPTLISFTESPEKGEADRQTAMKPGRYLTRFYPDLDPKKVAYYAEWWTTGLRPQSETNNTLHFASTEAEIIEVYEQGPGSCMQGSDCVRVYAAGDLAVAYTRRAEDDKVITRSLCWPAKKVYGRLYPAYSEGWEADGFTSEEESLAAKDELDLKLRALGYETIYQNPRGFDGARLQKISSEGGNWVMPYMDHGNIEDRGNHFVMMYGGNIDASSTGGTIEIEDNDDNDTQCYHCNEWTDDISSYDRVGGYSVEICSSCAENHTFLCEATETDYYDPDRDHAVLLNDGSIVHQNWADDNTYTCDYNADRYITENDPPVFMWDGTTWSPQSFALAGFTCELTGKHVQHNSWLDYVADRRPNLFDDEPLFYLWEEQRRWWKNSAGDLGDITQRRAFTAEFCAEQKLAHSSLSLEMVSVLEPQIELAA